MSTFQSYEVTTTTDGSGYFSFQFPDPIDQAVAGPNEPQSGPARGEGLVGVSALVTGTSTVKVRCWEANGAGGIRTSQNKQVTVTILGITG